MKQPSEALRLVLCDDHVMLLEGLAAALTASGHEVAATTPDPNQVVGIVAELRPDVCILDVGFPDGDGMQAAAEIAKVAPDTEILFLSAMLTPEIVRRALDIGVKGFVRKDVSIDGVLHALERLADDQVTIERGLLQRAMGDKGGQGRAERSEPLAKLTRREREVLDLLVEGIDTAEIAQTLQVGESTVRSHVQNVLTKLGVHSRLQAVAYAAAQGQRRPPVRAERRTENGEAR